SVLLYANATVPTETHTLSLHDALPISGVDATLNHQSVRLRRLFQVCEVRTLDALLMHPQIAGIHSQVIARRTGTDDDHAAALYRSEEHTSELQSRENLVCRLLLEKKKK